SDEDTNLMAANANGICDQSIEADRRKQERHGAEKQKQKQSEALGPERISDDFVHRADVIDGLLGIHRSDGFPNRGRQLGGVCGTSYDDRHDSWCRFLLVEREINLWPHRCFEDTRLLYIRND